MQIQPHFVAVTVGVLLTLLSVSCRRDDSELILAFAREVRSAVIEFDAIAFSQLPCIPDSCRISQTVIDRIFGDAGFAINFQEIMRNPKLDIRIIGPYTREEFWPGSTYTVVFYTPENSPFESDGQITQEGGLIGLYKTFLQTEATVSNGVVYFHRVPFYFETHHPYASDYD